MDVYADLCQLYGCWYNGLSLKDKNSLNSIIKVCSKIISVHQRDLGTIWEEQVPEKAKRIISQPDHVLSNEFSLMPAGRCYNVHQRLPVWIASLIRAAEYRKSDVARRKKAYRLLQRKLILNRIGVQEGDLHQPTYVYPDAVKMLLRTVFSQNICDYPDPCHDQVVYITVDDLHSVQIS